MPLQPKLDVELPVGPPGARKISPTDISQFIRLEQCQRYLRLRLHERTSGRAFLTDYDVWPQPISPLLSESGSDFEERIEAAVAARFSTVNYAGTRRAGNGTEPNNAEVLRQARSLAAGERVFLFQVRLTVPLAGWQVRGDIDILRMESDTQGALHLLIADMKSSASTKVEHYLQVAFYQSMLSHLLDEAGVPYSEILPGILYRGAAHEASDLTASDRVTLEAQQAAANELFGVEDALLEMVGDPQAYLDSVEDLVTGRDSTANRLADAPFDEIPFHLTYKCDGCIYNEYCMKWAAERDDLSLIPHLTAVEKEVLRRQGVESVHDVAVLKEFRKEGTPSSGLSDLVPAAGKEKLVRKLAATWPVGPRIDELVYRSRYYRARWKKDPIESRAYIPNKGHGSLPYSDANHNPNLVRVYIDAQHDYLNDRIYLLGALVSCCEAGVPGPERRRHVVHMTAGPPDTAEKERALFVGWIDETLRAILELAAPDEAGEKRAPIHLIFFNRYDQRVLLDGLGRHLPSILGATPLYDFMTQIAAFDSPLITFLDEESRELKNYPMVCQSLQAVSAFLKYDWSREAPYRELFKERMFDFWGKLDDETVPEGESPWYTNRARFKSDIPLEYAYAAWGELPPASPGKEDPYSPYRPVTQDLLVGFQRARLEAIEHVVGNFRGNHLTEKTSFVLPDLARFSDKASSLARALQEFVAIERHVELAAWKSTRNSSPEQRALMGETLLARYHDADQQPDAAALNREAMRLEAIRAKYAEAYLAANPGAAKAQLTIEQRAETGWSLEGVAFVLRVDCDGTDASLDEILSLSNLRDGERVVLEARYTYDSRLPVGERVPITPTPKQLLHGTRADIERVEVVRDAAGVPLSANLHIRITGAIRRNLEGFVFQAYTEPLQDGALYTLDPDPNSYYEYWGHVVSRELSSLVAAGQAQVHALYGRLTSPTEAEVAWGPEAVGAQGRFLRGLEALHEEGAFHTFEPSKRDYIGSHGAVPVLLVQGPPGTGKSYSTAFAIFARLQGAMAEGRDFRAFLSCKTHAATDVLAESVQSAQEKLRELSRSHPGVFGRYFDPRLLDVPLYRMDGKKDLKGIQALLKDKAKEKGEPRNADVLAKQGYCVVAATPGGIYSMVRDRWKNKNLFGHYICNLLVLDEASQMNLPEAALASLPLSTGGQLIVVGDPRQMPPIVKHDWEGERRRTFQEYKSYSSLFDTLLALDPQPPMIKFEESFRLHADMAEFLRREIYSKDSIAYHSNKHDVLTAITLEDAFTTAALSPEHPIVVIVHDEAHSQTRNVFEQALVAPILHALSRADLYDLEPREGLGVVVPHRAQRADMQSAFPSLRVLDPETGAVLLSAVDTVERFQGGERTAILVSATESDRDYLLASGGFLYDPRRLTVAVSRAKQKLILVASRTVFSTFSPDEEAFANAQLWKNLLRRTCTVLLWEGERDGHRVQVWGNASLPERAPGPL